MAVWDATFTADPLATDLVSAGDNEIRDTRAIVRDELRVEHDVGDVTTDADYTDTGRHNPGSARAFFIAAAPVVLSDPTDGGVWPPTTGHLDHLGAGAVDNGRLWVDFDDGQPYVRESEITGANWSPPNVDAGTSAAAWVSLYPRTWTTVDVANNNNQTGSVVNIREGVDSAGGVGGVLGVSIVCPADGKDYEIVVEATCTYFIDNESIGFWLVEDNGGTNDRDYKLAYSQTTRVVGEVTLTYTQNNPTNGDTYDYTVEFATSNALNNDCTVNPEEGIGNMPALLLDFDGETSWSRITATIKPRYLSASYTV